MKRMVLILLFLSIGLANAQSKKSAILEGIIIDQQSGEALPKANISLLNPIDSSIVTGDIADGKGKFQIKNIPYGNYLLRVKYVGYDQSIIDNLSLNSSDTKQLGKIALKQTAALMPEVKVSAEREMMQFQNGKKVFNVDKNISAAGGTAVDVLKNIPSVNIDVDGNISLRGSSNLNIMINGKPSTIMQTGSNALEQIPSGAIDKIEIITNPSAKYEAEGMTGIINIVMKQDNQSGVNGLATMNIGTKDKYAAGISLNYNFGNFNIFSGYDYGNRRGGMDGSSVRKTTVDTNTTFLKQSVARRPKFLSHNAKLGFDYFIDPFNSLTMSGNFRINTRDFGVQSSNYLIDFASSPINTTIRNNREKDDGPSFDYSSNYKHKFDAKGHELTADIFYSKYDDNEIINLNEIMYDAAMNPLPNQALPQKSDNDNIYKTITLQSDYVLPFENGDKIESGFKFNNKIISSDLVYSSLTQANIWDYDSSRSNSANYDERILATYFIYNGKFSDFSYSLGLRAEQTNMLFEQRTLDQDYKQDYFKLFPSISASYKFTQSDELQASYSRRINRPNSHQLNPFIDYGDPNSIRYGNPKLKPELVDAYELAFVKNFEMLSITPTLFYRKTTDIISRFAEVVSSEVIATTFENMSKGEDYGLEFNISADYQKWLRMSADFSYYKTSIEGEKGLTKYNNEDYSWTSRFNFNIMLMRELSFQITGNYTGPTVQAQGTRDPMYSIDLGARYDIFDRKASLTFRVSDIFDTMTYSGSTKGQNFDYDFDFKRQTRIAYIGFQYKINDGQQKREKKRTQDMENSGDMDF